MNDHNSKWAEIKTDYIDESDGFWRVDAWRTNDDNEEGKVIAYIEDGTDTPVVLYCDPEARADTYAQEIIADKIKEIQAEYANETAKAIMNEPTMYAYVTANSQYNDIAAVAVSSFLRELQQIMWKDAENTHRMFFDNDDLSYNEEERSGTIVGPMDWQCGNDDVTYYGSIVEIDIPELPPKTGEWLGPNDGYNTCSVCKSEVAEYDDSGRKQEFSVCPYCGSAMR